MITRRGKGSPRRFAVAIGGRRARREPPRGGVTAFVLSGGASLGAGQVGMLHALYERGVVPDMLVASSAGALNAAFVASRPQRVETADQLADVWRSLRRADVFPLRPLAALRGLAGSRDHLVDGGRLRALIERHIEFDRLEHAPLPLHVVAVDVCSAREVRLSSGSAVDAVLASAAVPAVFPPVRVDGMELVDGGVANHVPISHAVELGATTVYVLATGDPEHRPRPQRRGALTALLEATSLMTQRRLAADLAVYASEVELVVMRPPPTDIQPIDFSRAAELIEQTLTAARAQLDTLAVEMPSASVPAA